MNLRGLKALGFFLMFTLLLNILGYHFVGDYSHAFDKKPISPKGGAPVDFIQIWEEFPDLFRGSPFDSVHDLTGAPFGLSSKVQMNVVFTYRKLVDLPTVELTTKLNHPLDSFGYSPYQNSLAIPRNKDKVIS